MFCLLKKNLIWKMFVVQLAILSTIFLGLLISNVLTVMLTALFIFEGIPGTTSKCTFWWTMKNYFQFLDENSNLQGADYYIFSLAISDLILALFLIPFSLISLSVGQWSFGPNICEFCAYLWFSLWLVNIYNFLLLSADRCLYITDKKYCQYKSRTRAR